METVDMRCPSCGGSMKIENGQFVCPYCGSIAINIAETQVDDSTARLSVEEFAKKLAENKKLLVVKMDSSVEIFDVEAKIINKKVADATSFLKCGEYDKVEEILKNVRGVFSVSRLRFLANCKVKSESELIELPDGFWHNYGYAEYWEALLGSCNEETRKVYIELEQYSRKRAGNYKNIKNEIHKAHDLCDAKLYKDCVDYARAMCVKYPTTAMSWETLAYFLIYYKRCILDKEEKNNILGKSDEKVFDEVNDAIKKMKLCPDYGKRGQSRLVKQYVYENKENSVYEKSWCYFDIETKTKFGSIKVQPQIEKFGSAWIYKFLGVYTYYPFKSLFCFNLTFKYYFLVAAALTLLGGLTGLILTLFGIGDIEIFKNMAIFNWIYKNDNLLSMSHIIKGLLVGVYVGLFIRPAVGLVFSIVPVFNFLFYPIYLIVKNPINESRAEKENMLNEYNEFEKETDLKFIR